MPTLQSRKSSAFRAVQIFLVLLGGGLILLGVAFGFPPHTIFVAAALSTLAGALTLGIGWPALSDLGMRNRRRYDAHLRVVRDQVSLLSGSYGTKQGFFLGDWRNARWRDVGPTGERAAYKRLPLLVPQEDVRWAVAITAKVNTGVPIDEIAGLGMTLQHLASTAPGRLDVPALVRDAAQCLSYWRAFDSLFEERLLSLAPHRIRDPPLGFEVGWEDVSWSAPTADRWTLSGEGLAFLSMIPPQTTDTPQFHPARGGDGRWSVRLGDSSVWLLTGGQPSPGPHIEEDFVGLISVLMGDPRLQAAYTQAVDYAAALRERVNVTRRTLREYPIDLVDCESCREIWLLGPSSD
jgi:hypothetical protein